MLTDSEVESLARSVIEAAIAELEKQPPAPFVAVRQTPTGEPVIVYRATSPDHGAFDCEYAPLGAVKNIVRVCERYYDNFPVVKTDPQTGKTVKLSLNPQTRDQGVGNMAANAAYHLIANFRTELWLTIEESLEDSYLIAAGVLASVVGVNLTARAGEATSDATDAITKASKRVARQKRYKLRLFLKQLPSVNAGRDRGGSKARHDWTDEEYDLLAREYDQLKETWIDAKRIAKLAQKSTNHARKKAWRVEVMRAYPDLPSDLLERFANPRAGDAKPSDIALIHAKRQAGVTENYTPRELREKIKAWKLKHTE